MTIKAIARLRETSTKKEKSTASVVWIEDGGEEGDPYKSDLKNDAKEVVKIYFKAGRHDPTLQKIAKAVTHFAEGVSDSPESTKAISRQEYEDLLKKEVLDLLSKKADLAIRSLHSLQITAGVDESYKKKLLTTIKRTISQLGIKSSKLNTPRRLQPFEKEYKRKLISVFYKLDKAKTDSEIKALEVELVALKNSWNKRR
jgi:hypothetical protein